MSSPKITIGIPTYNRSETIRANVASVIDLLPDWAELLICDNASSPTVDLGVDVLARAQARGVRIRVHRNPANVGATANIMRLFEMVETDWLLLLGDDDPVMPESLDQVARLIADHGDDAVIKFSSTYFDYAQERTAANFAELMEHGGTFNHLLFMSTYLYNVKQCWPYLRYGYMMAIAAAPQLAIMLMASLAKRPILLSPVRVARARDAEPAWSPADLRLNFYHLADLPLGPAERRLLRRKIYADHNVFREFLDIASVHRSHPHEAAYIRRKAVGTHRLNGHGAKRWVARFLLLVGRVSGRRFIGPLERLYSRTKGRTYQHAFSSRHDRL